MFEARLSTLRASTALAVLLPFHLAGHLFGSSIIQANICSVPAIAPTFTTASNSTTATAEVISGTTSANTNLTVANNSQQVASLTSNSSGGFSLQVSLSLGANRFTAQAVNNCGSVNSTNSVVITRTALASTQPSSSSTQQATAAKSSNNSTANIPLQLLNLTASAYSVAGSTTTAKSIFLRGITTPGATVTIADNQQQVAQLTAAPDGSFGVAVPLRVGRNTVTITSTFNGRSTTQTITYNRLSPAVHHSNTTWKLVSAFIAFLLLVMLSSFLIVFRHRKHRQQSEPPAPVGQSGGVISG